MAQGVMKHLLEMFTSQICILALQQLLPETLDCVSYYDLILARSLVYSIFTLSMCNESGSSFTAEVLAT